MPLSFPDKLLQDAYYILQNIDNNFENMLNFGLRCNAPLIKVVINTGFRLHGHSKWIWLVYDFVCNLKVLNGWCKNVHVKGKTHLEHFRKSQNVIQRLSFWVDRSMHICVLGCSALIIFNKSLLFYVWTWRVYNQSDKQKQNTKS